MVTGLVNSDGNYLLIDNSNKMNVNVRVWKDKDTCDAWPENGALVPFDKLENGNLHCGAELDEGLNAPASGAGGKTVKDNILMVIYDVIVAQAAIDQARHAFNGILGDWVKFVPVT